MLGVLGLVFWVWGLGFGVWGMGFGVWVQGFRFFLKTHSGIFVEGLGSTLEMSAHLINSSISSC